jgi:hypothetical protein
MTEVVKDEAASQMVEDAKKAYTALSKGSRLRKHYIALTVMNNVFRAFVTMYELEPEYVASQKAFLKVLLDSEARRNRFIFKPEFEIIAQALIHYESIIISATDEQLKEMLLLVEGLQDDCKYVVTRRKN